MGLTMKNFKTYCQKATALNVCKHKEISGFINDLKYITLNFRLILANEADLADTHKQTNKDCNVLQLSDDF